MNSMVAETAQNGLFTPGNTNSIQRGMRGGAIPIAIPQVPSATTLQSPSSDTPLAAAAGSTIQSPSTPIVQSENRTSIGILMGVPIMAPSPNQTQSQDTFIRQPNNPYADVAYAGIPGFYTGNGFSTYNNSQGSVNGSHSVYNASQGSQRSLARLYQQKTSNVNNPRYAPARGGVQRSIRNQNREPDAKLTDWSHGLFQCHKDLTSCTVGLMCPPVAEATLGRSKSTSLAVSTVTATAVTYISLFSSICCLTAARALNAKVIMMACSLPLLILALLVRTGQVICFFAMRRHLVKRYGITEPIVKSCCISCFFRPCQLCQELKTVETKEFVDVIIME